MARLSDIRLRRSAVSGSIPSTSNLNLGELALNTADGKVYMKKSVGGTDTVVEVGGNALSASFTAYEYTATANQTTFSGSDNNSNTLAYNTGTPPKVQVFMNGILLDEGSSQDYTASNGTSVVLTTAAGASDLVQIHAYKSDISNITDISFDDNVKLSLGDSQDLQIYHSGSKSYIKDAGTGNLAILTSTLELNNAADSQNMIVANDGGAVSLYHAGSNKLATTSSGVTITGTAVATAFTGNLTGNVTGNVTGTASTVTTAAQTAITSVGSLTGLDVNGAVTINDNLSLDGSNKELRFYEGSNYVGFEAGALSADQIWVLPTADGSAGHALKTDGSGNLSWGLAGGNAFETIAISGQSSIVADSISDTLTFAGGSGITLTTNASTDTITITNTSLGANAFGNVAVSGQTTVAADSTGDTLTLVGQNGVTITTNASSDTVTIDGHTSYAPFNTDLFTGNGSTTAFVLSSTPSTEDNLIVFLEGVYQNKNSYSLSGSTLTLTPAISTGLELVVHQIGDVVSGVGLLRNNFTGDGSTTNFTLSQDPLHEDNLFIYFDGVYQNKSEFSVSGTTLSFSTAPDSGDAIEVIVPKMTEIQTPSVNAIDDATQFNTANIIPQVVTSTSISSTSATTIASHAAATYRTVKYLVQCTQGTDYHSTEINLIHDGTTVYITEYGSLWDNASLGTFDATISGGNILLQITAGSASSMTTKVISTAIPL